MPNGSFILKLHAEIEEDCEIYDSVSGTFELLSDETFSVTYDGNTVIYTIVSISETELIVSWTSGGTLITIVLDKNPGNG